MNFKHDKHASSCCHHHDKSNDSDPKQNNKTKKIPANWFVSEWYVAELDCPNEEKLIKKAFMNLTDIQFIGTNLLQHKVIFAHAKPEEMLIGATINKLGFHARLIEADAVKEATQDIAINNDKKTRLNLTLSGILALMTLIAHFAHFPNWVVIIGALLSISFCGFDIFKKALIAIRMKSLNINVLLSVAVIGALLIGEFAEAAIVMFLFCLAEYLETLSLNKARQNIEKLLNLAPETITIKNDANQWEAVPVENVTVNTIALVKPGEKVALDGIICKGVSTLNEAPITGESISVEKKSGDPIFAGTINEIGTIEYQITATSHETMLAKIITLVEEAQVNKAPTQRVIDKFAAYYIPVVFILAIIIAIVPALFWGNWTQWIYNSLVLLVISCPCALVISTPITIISGLTVAAKKGILIKGGVYLELARNIHWLAMDKTGTITKGKPEVTDFINLIKKDDATINLLSNSLVFNSNHPISNAIANFHHINQDDLLKVSHFKEILGMGIEGVIENKKYYLVNPRFLTQSNIQDNVSLTSEINQYQQSGKTVVLFCDENKVLALYAVMDEIKEDTIATINQLHQMGLKTVMITGDNHQVAEIIAKRIGIDEVYTQQLPADKLKIIEAKAKQQELVAMVGDGINDAPALAQADIGISMGKLGTDIAIETADIILMDDQLNKIIDLINISKKTHILLIENISFAIGIKLLFIILTLLSISSMWGAIFADVGATLLVIINGCRLIFNDKETTIKKSNEFKLKPAS